MGTGIAENLRRAGFELTVWNRAPAKAAEFAAAGGRAAATPAEAAANVDVLTSCLFDDASLLSVLEGPDGVLSTLPQGAVHVSITTVSPGALARAEALHRAHGSMLVGGTVLGRPDKSASGELVSLVAGAPEARESANQVIRSYSQEVIEVGNEPSQAAAIKLSVNGALIGLIELIGEMNAVGQAYGIAPTTIAEALTRVLSGGPAEGYAHRIADQEYEPAGFAMAGGLKDVDLALSAADAVDASTPMLALARDRVLTALGLGWGAKDWSAIADISMMNAGLHPASRPSE